MDRGEIHDAGELDAHGADGTASADAQGLDADLPDLGPPPTDDCITEATSGRRTFDCGGLSFDLSVPPQCVSGGCGLITDVHGFSMSGVMQENNTRLAALGVQHGYVVIQPNASGARYLTSWRVQDDPVIFDFIQRAARVFRVDDRRIHFTGFSQGGYTAWRFVCQHSDYFASIALAAGASNCPAGGNLPGSPGIAFPACTFQAPEVPAQPIPVLYMHGRFDENYVPFSCAAAQVDAARQHWSLTGETPVSADPMHTRTRYTGSGPALLETLFHDYTSSEDVTLVAGTELRGHCFPGSTDPGNEPGQFFSFACQQPSAFVWGEEAIRFFIAHPRP